VSNVFDMSELFWGASSFDQDLSNWCAINISEEPDHFATSSNLRREFYPEWGTCGTYHVTEISKNFSTYKLYLFPNPASNVLFIKNFNDDCLVSIYDMTGELVTKKLLKNPYLNIGHLRNGEYLLRMESPEGTGVEMFIKL